MSVYQPCDIRGPVTELSADLYRSWGRSIAARLRPGGQVDVGGDVRLSTPAFKAALIEGLTAGGMAVRDLGIVPTPLVYWAGRQHGAAASAIVTASHSPPDINGLKWVIGDLPPTEAEVAEFEREAEARLSSPEPVAPRERRPPFPRG
ncbi:phosphomannomutase/phosphoglucomutase, partial [bacterium]|nr:phosphomannomutase/phosphoglucomutase [bacterium]